MCKRNTSERFIYEQLRSVKERSDICTKVIINQILISAEPFEFQHVTNLSFIFSRLAKRIAPPRKMTSVARFLSVSRHAVMKPANLDSCSQNIDLVHTRCPGTLNIYIEI